MSDQNKFTRIKGISDIRRLPRLGKIRLGIKKESKGGKEYPCEVDHFVVPPEVAAKYGDTPKALDVMFPTENEHAIFPQAYKWYQSSGLRCKGDGMTAMRRAADIEAGSPEVIGAIPKDPNELVEVKCPCSLLDSGQCGQKAALMVLLPEVSLGGIFQIATGSFHNIVRINSCIDYIRGIVGRIAMVPMILRRQEETIEYEGKKAKHYLLQLEFNANLDDVRRLRENAMAIIERQSHLALPAPEDDIEEVEVRALPAAEPEPVAQEGEPLFEDAINAAETVEELDETWKRLFAVEKFKKLAPTEKARLQTIKDTRKAVLGKRKEKAIA